MTRVVRRLRAGISRRSFDYQWRALPEGNGLLSDPRFGDNVDRILSEEELRIARPWFKGKRVLDAGCGNGRWIEGFRRLGAEVTALDTSPGAIAAVKARFGPSVATVHGNVLEADRILAPRQFDLVFSWGVLHHTEDAASGIRALSTLVAPDGLMYVYLYGAHSLSRRESVRLASQRLILNLLPFGARRRLLERLYGRQRAHEIFDAISTPLNQRFTVEDATAMLTEAGLARVVQTLPHTEVFLRADHGASSADPHLLPEPPRPFWFERLGERD